jgi:NAD(P)-dependent dehydrogenase (short-subunit alcohol dehydrogenase family)
MTGRFVGRTVIVTGAASGIGRSAALRFATEGASVVAADINEEGGEETVDMSRGGGGEVAFLRADVSIEADIARLVQHTITTFGGVDILFNNAGAGGTIGPIEHTPADDWDRTFCIVLRSVLLGIKHVVPQMKKQGRGSIVSTSSVAGIRGYGFSHAYCAAKAGVINLTRSTAVELAQYGIRANCVCPGAIATPMQYDTMGAQLDAKLAARQPIGRAGQPSDVAGAVLYLASDDAEWVTGQAIVIDGGVTLGIWNYQADGGASQRPLDAATKFANLDNSARPSAPGTTFLGPSYLSAPSLD